MKRPRWLSAWLRILGRKGDFDPVPLRRHPKLLRDGIRLLARQARPDPRTSLAGQPFDRELLRLSPIYKLGRARFLSAGGTFTPALVSSARTLSSAGLLELEVAYSPVEDELIWAAATGAGGRELPPLLALRGYVTSVFHEQNHRILWRQLPPPGPGAIALRRYLNLAEALVVAADMALGDQLGPGAATLFYLVGAIYDPGTRVREELGTNPRAYRNYLHALTYASYLLLEGFEPRGIERGICALYPHLGKLAERAARRSCRLDALFVDHTNPQWQALHHKRVRPGLARLVSPDRGGPLTLPDDPMDNRLVYLVAERWFIGLGL